MFTLGLIPTFARNFLLCLGFIPSFVGQDATALQTAYALGGILLSHPFEVARVTLQYHGSKSGVWGDSWNCIRGLYSSDGVVGLYRGVVPRTIHLLPTLITLTSI